MSTGWYLAILIACAVAFVAVIIWGYRDAGPTCDLCHGDGGWTRANGYWQVCMKCSKEDER